MPPEEDESVEIVALHNKTLVWEDIRFESILIVLPVEPILENSACLNVVPPRYCDAQAEDIAKSAK